MRVNRKGAVYGKWAYHKRGLLNSLNSKHLANIFRVRRTDVNFLIFFFFFFFF